MRQSNRLKLSKTGLLRTIFGGLLLVPSIPFVASAQTSQVLNPCPRIYYEEPYDSTRIVPEGCPPNAATRILRGGQVPQQQVENNAPSQPPLPENRSQAVAKVMPMNGNVDVKVKNNTNDVVTYQAIGQTSRRILPGGQETLLRNLPTPVTVTFVQQDDGFVRVMPMSVSKDGVLEVALDEDANPRDSNQGVLRIQRDGQVFLN